MCILLSADSTRILVRVLVIDDVMPFRFGFAHEWRRILGELGAWGRATSPDSDKAIILRENATFFYTEAAEVSPLRTNRPVRL